MPYIQINTNLEMSPDRISRLKEEFGRAITSFPGKTERWLMVECNPSRTMFFHGSDAPCALVCVELFGKANSDAYDTMTAETTRILGEVLSLPPDSIYVKYEEISNWGWNGTNF